MKLLRSFMQKPNTYSSTAAIRSKRLASQVERHHRLHRLVEVAEPVGSGRWIVADVERPRVPADHVTGAVGDQRDRLAPIGRELAVGNDQFAHHGVVDERQQFVLRADVVVERHRAGIEFGGEATHRESVETFLVGDLDRCGGDLVARELVRRPGSGRVHTSWAAIRAVRSSSRADLRASSADAWSTFAPSRSATCSTFGRPSAPRPATPLLPSREGGGRTAGCDDCPESSLAIRTVYC